MPNWIKKIVEIEKEIVKEKEKEDGRNKENI